MSHKLWLIIIETTIQVKSLLYPDLKVFSSQTDIPGAWIGLTISLDSDADIIYKWEDGFPMTSTYWAANQPDQQNIGLYHTNRIPNIVTLVLVADPGYTCVLMNMPSGRWSNSYTQPTQNICEQLLPRVCKINLGMISYKTALVSENLF